MVDCDTPKDKITDLSSSSEVVSNNPKKTDLWDVGGIRRFFQAIVQKKSSLVKERIRSDPTMATMRHPLGWYPIHTAVLAGDIEIISFLLDQPMISANTPDESRFSGNSSSVNSACRRSEFSPRVVEFIDTSGATPLHFACLTGDWSIIKLLLTHGAAPLIKDKAERLPIHYFDWERNPQAEETAKLYNRYVSKFSFSPVETKEDISGLFQAIRLRDHKACEEILRVSPETVKGEYSGSITALLVAIIAGNLPAVKMIVATNKTSLGYTDSYTVGYYGDNRDRYFQKSFRKLPGRNSTPLHYACMIGNWGIIEELLNAGADCLRKNDDERIPRDFLDEYVDEDTIEKYDALCQKLEEAKREKEKMEREERERAERERQAQEAREREEKKKTEQQTVNGLPHNAENIEGGDEKDLHQDNGKGNSGDDDVDDDEGKPEEKKSTQGNENSEAAQRNKYRREHPIADYISAKVVGQRGPIQSLASAIRLRENGWARTNSPLVFLFLGSSGVGKTEIAKQLTVYLNHQPWKTSSRKRKHRDSDSDSDNEGKSDDPLVAIEKSNAFIRLDMSEFQQRHTVQNITGAPKSYVGYGDGGTLSSKLHKNPEAIVLLDEIEKAHPEVLTVFLQLFDDGRITDSSRGTVYCPNAIFIMTSNLASDQIKENASILRLDEKDPMRNDMQSYRETTKKFLKLIYPTLKEGFKRDEFLGRINQILIMLPLSEDEVGIIIEKHLRSWRDHTREKHFIQLTWSPEVVNHLSKAYNVHFGARSLAYEVEYVVLRLVAEAQMADELSEGWLVHLVMDKAGDTISMRTSKPKELERRGCRMYNEC